MQAKEILAQYDTLKRPANIALIECITEDVQYLLNNFPMLVSFTMAQGNIFFTANIPTETLKHFLPETSYENIEPEIEECEIDMLFIDENEIDFSCSIQLCKTINIWDDVQFIHLLHLIKQYSYDFELFNRGLRIEKDNVIEIDPV